MHKREVCKHGTLVWECICNGPNKTDVLVECPPECEEEVRLTLVVTIRPKPGNTVEVDSSGERYVKSRSGTESLHPFDVMDVIRDELDSCDRTGGGRGQIFDCLWEVKSIKLANDEGRASLD